MTCSRCQLDARACDCASRQGSLLPASPEWRFELQQRVDAYRVRRRLPPAVPPVEFEAPPGEPAAGPRVLAFPVASPPRGGLLRAAVAAAPEPLADPVVLAPRPRESALAVALVQIWEAPPLVLPPPAPLSTPAPEPALAESVARPVRERRPSPAAAPARDAAYLQIALPISSLPAAPAPAPPAVAPRRLRLRAGCDDAAVVAVAALLFALAGWAALGCPAPEVHDLRHLLPAVAAVPGLLAALYLLACCYAGGVTVGMRRQGLCVVGFDGPPTAAALRRRAWASLMSLAALGLGFAWIFCDSQHLTWHDYISRTLVVPSPQNEA